MTTLWEDSRTVDSATDLSKAEIVTVYPHRHMVPPACGGRCASAPSRTSTSSSTPASACRRTRSSIDLLKTKVRANAQVRILLGDPEL